MHLLFSFPLVSMSATEFIEPFPNSRTGKVEVKFGGVLKLVDCVSVRLTISAVKEVLLSNNRLCHYHYLDKFGWQKQFASPFSLLHTINNVMLCGRKYIG